MPMKFEITSVGNSRIKFFRTLRQKKVRQETGLFLIEGEKLFLEALTYAPEAVIGVVTTTDRKFENFSGDVYLVPEHVLGSLSELVSPEGIVGIVDLSKLTYRSTGEKVCILDGVSIPANAGAILRSCAAFGFDKLYLHNCCDVYEIKALRASMGAIFRCEVLITHDLAALLHSLPMPVYGAHMEGAELDDIPSEASTTLVFGSESHGLSEVVKNSAKLIKIPMSCQCESLNCAVAAGIILYKFRK